MILRFNNWSGGISDDQESLNQNAASLLQGFNIHERPPHLVSNVVITKFAGQSSIGSIPLWIGKSPLTAGTNVYAVVQAGNRWKQTSGSGTFSVEDLGATTITRAISGIDVYNSGDTATTAYIITCFSNGAVEKVDFDSTPTPTTIRASGTEGPVFWFKKAGKVYIGNGNTLDAYSGTGSSVTSAVLTLAKDDQIYRLDEYQHYLAVFTQGLGSRRRYLYLWDTFSSGVNSVYLIPEAVDTAQGFASRNVGGLLYFVTGTPITLYVFDGSSVKRLWRYPRHLSQAFEDTTISIYPNAAEGFDGRFFFGLGNASSGNANSFTGLWSWGKRDEKYPNAIALEVLKNGATTQDVGVTCLKEVSGALRMGIYDGTTYETGYVSKVASSVNKENGVLESLWIDPSDFGIGKPGDQYQILRAGILTRPLSASTSATIKIKYDYDATAYSSVSASVTHSTSSDTFIATDVGGNVFRKFQFRVDTTAATTNAPDVVEVYFDIVPVASSMGSGT